MNIAFDLLLISSGLKSFIVATLPWGTIALAFILADGIYSRRHHS